MEPGDIVEFFEDKRIFLGVVLELKGERLHVLTQTSREMTLTPKRVLHVGPRLPVAALSRQELLRHLEGKTALHCLISSRKNIRLIALLLMKGFLNTGIKPFGR